MSRHAMLPPPPPASSSLPSLRPTPVPSNLGIGIALAVVTGQATSGTVRPGSR